MNRCVVALLFGSALMSAPMGVAIAQSPAPAAKSSPPPAAAAGVTIEVLRGSWVRPDGGYTIAIKSIGTNGQLEAAYFNPNPLPFATAQAAQDGASVRVFLELRAGGYAGSTYELTYDPADDRLKGVYYQAVMKQKFDVYFVRK